MQSKTKRILSTLMALTLVSGLYAAVPLTARAENFNVSNAAELEQVLYYSVDGDVITLKDNIGYHSCITIDDKTVTINLNGYSLNVRNDSGVGLEVVNGELRLTGETETGKFRVGGSEAGVFLENGKATVSSAGNVSLEEGHSAVRAERGSDITVTGNVLSGSTIGVYAEGSTVTVNGSVTFDTYEYMDNTKNRLGVDCVASIVTVGGSVFAAGLNAVGVRVRDYGTVQINGTLLTVGDNSVDMVINGKNFAVGAPTYSEQSPQTPADNYREVYTDGGSAVYLWHKEDDAVAPAITGPEEMTLALGYAAASSGVFTITGDPAPTVRVASPENDKITWNNTTKRIDIAPGIATGIYAVSVDAFNSAGEAERHWFFLTVTGVVLGAQSGTLKAGTAGAVTFPVSAGGTANGKTGIVTWYESATGIRTGPTPAWITATVSNVASGSATVTMTFNNAAAASPGSYYFKVTIDGTASNTATLTILPADASPMDNFVKTETYTPGQFTDVNEDAWYGANGQNIIGIVYEYGLMNGVGIDLFDPMGNVMVVQAIVMAVRVHSIYMTGSAEFTQGGVWYQQYVDYAVANGIIAANDFPEILRPATRAEMAYIFSRALPASEFPEINTVNSLPDVNAGTPYYASIIMLYKAGIFTGSDYLGTFLPDTNIMRVEAAAILSRLILPDTRTSGKVYG